jgi:hypothetical protein
MRNGMERPIGYWLKHVDRLLDAATARVFAEEGLTRRHWQVMNVLRGSPRDEVGLTEALRPFWGDGAITLDEVLTELTGRGWVAPGHELTPAGVTAHAAIEKKVLGIRETTQAGLSEEDYHHTITVLRRMARNLEVA